MCIAIVMVKKRVAKMRGLACSRIDTYFYVSTVTPSGAYPGASGSKAFKMGAVSHGWGLFHS
jgi:hypothetical protein